MKKFLSKIAIAILIVSLLPTISFAETTNTLKSTIIYYNGAIEKDNQLFIPLRPFFQTLGAPIITDQKTKTTKVYYKNTLLEYKVNSRDVKVNNETRTMESAPFLVKGTLYIPLKETAQFISSSITKVELDKIQTKYFWGYTIEELITLEGEEYATISLPYGEYTLEDAWKIVNRYEGNHVHEKIVTQFKGMEGDYYLFHTYFIPEFNGKYDNFIPIFNEINNDKYERYLWNRYLVHKDTGKLIVQ